MGRDWELEQRNKRRLGAGIVISVVYYVFLWLSVIGTSEVEDVVFFSIHIPMVTIRCLIMLVQMILAPLLVIEVRKRGLVIAIILLSANGIMSLNGLFIAGTANAVNGFLMSIYGVIISCVIYMFVRKVEQNEAKFVTLLDTDDLTELPNRRALLNQIDYKVARGENFALLLLDIDNFKTVNDTVGHDYGDMLLIQFANQWREFPSRKGDYFGRSGGDEFILLVDVNNNKKELVEQVENTVNGNQFSHDYVVGDVHFYITASIGIAFFPDDADDTAKLLQCADTALYMAKEKGKQGVCTFDKTFIETVSDTLSIENIIRTAVDQDSLFIDFQPQFQIDGKTIRGFEALSRIRMDDGKIIPPGVYIPVAENSFLVALIDKRVIRHAMEEFIPLLDSYPDLILSVNVSVRYLYHEKFLEDIETCLRETGFPAKNLEVEITESVFISSRDYAISTLWKLRDLGVHIALDDFGTGYASLSYINSLPIDTVKIDKAFIDKLSKEKPGNVFVEAIVVLGHTLNLEVISEGVETQVQAELLKDIKCDYIQGFIWGKPMTLTAAKELLQQE